MTGLFRRNALQRSPESEGKVPRPATVTIEDGDPASEGWRAAAAAAVVAREAACWAALDAWLAEPTAEAHIRAMLI